MRTLISIGAVVLLALAIAPSQAQDPSGQPGLSRAQGPSDAGAECAELRARLDSLEVKIEKIIMENVDANPYATGETLGWGTGWTTSVLTAAANQWTIEVGYMFGFPGWTPPWEQKYIDSRRAYRLGVSAGFEYFRREGLLHKDNGDPYYAHGQALALKLTWGTPVLLNFISGTAFLRGLWILPDYDAADKGRDESIGGAGMGSTIEFWIARDKCLTVGFKLEGEWEDFIHDHNEVKDEVLPYEFRPEMGVRVFF